MENYVVVDTGNIFFRSIIVHRKAEGLAAIPLGIHTIFNVLKQTYRDFNKPKIVLCFDRKSWRKDVTNDKELYPFQIGYKANRQSKTAEDEQFKQKYIEALQHLETFFSEHTTLTVLSRDQLEADDLIYGFVRRFHEDNRIVVYSSDRDFLQLHRFSNVVLFDPATKKHITLDDYNDDPEWMLFLKCFRGDRSDNIPSAYPRIRTTKLLTAYSSPIDRENLMKEIIDHPLCGKVQVRELYAANKLLIDFSEIPQCLLDKIDQTIDDELNKNKKFNYFQFKRFCGMYNLTQHAENYNELVEMFSAK